MGAWGVEPFASDGALDWLGGQVTTPMAETIKRTLVRFLRYKKEERTVCMRDRFARVLINKPGRFSKRAVAAMRKAQRIVKMVGRRSSHDQAEAAAALLDECTSYGTRWRLFDYLAWAERVKKERKRKRGGSVAFHSAAIGSRSAQKWKKGKPPSVLPGGHRLVFDFSSEKRRIRLNYEAEHKELYSLAARAIREVMDDDAYLSSWRNGSEKRAALRPLLHSLERKALTEVHAAEKRLAESLRFRRVSRRRVAKKEKTTRAARKRSPRKK